MRLANFFRFKYKIPLCLRSNIICKSACGRCNAIYYGETCRLFKVRVGEHSGISPLTNKESLSISRDQPILNRNEASLPLYLFD